MNWCLLTKFSKWVRKNKKFAELKDNQNHNYDSSDYNCVCESFLVILFFFYQFINQLNTI